MRVSRDGLPTAVDRCSRNTVDDHVLPTVPDDDMRQLSSVDAPAASEAQRGDFAASAFADPSGEYGTMASIRTAANISDGVYGVKPVETAMATPADVLIRPAEGSISRTAN